MDPLDTDERLISVRFGPLLNRSSVATFLCYHSVAPNGPPFLAIEPEMFDRHLSILRARGYRSGNLDVLERIVQGGRPDGRHVFLTFDDGFEDAANVVLPLLERHGFTAFFFVLPPAVETGGPLRWPEVETLQRREPAIMRSLSWPMLERLVEHGCEIGSHGLSHRHLRELGDEELRDELVGSRRRIIERLGRCDTLAYPFGEWNHRVVRAAAAAGYRFAFTLPYNHQLKASALTIPRVTIDHRDDARRFSFKLSRGARVALASPIRTAFHAVRRPRGSGVA